MHKIVTAAFIAMLALAPSAAFACPRTARGDIGAQLSKRLNLTSDQRQQIDALSRNFHEQHHAFFEEVRRTRMAFREARVAGDKAKLEAMKPALDAQRVRMQELRNEQRRKIDAVLTAEQRAQLGPAQR